MLRKFLPLFILAVIALLVVIAFVVASPFFQTEPEVVAEKEVEKEEIVLSSIERKLNEIVIPELKFNNVTIDEAIEFLRLRSIECDSSAVDDSQKGIGFILRGRSRVSSDEDFGDVVDLNARLIKSMRLIDRPLGIVLHEVCNEAGLEWKIDHEVGKIVIAPKVASAQQE